MKVLYDHQIFMMQNYGGISRYFYELMKCYNENKTVNFELALKYSNNYYIEDARFSKHSNFFKNINPKLKKRLYYKAYDLTNTFHSNKIISKGDYDIFHPTYYESYFLDHIGNRPFVLTIHDMIHEVYKDQFPQNDKTAENKRLLAEKAAKIIAVSENTKRDIIKYYGINEEKIAVIYHGNSLRISKDYGIIDMDLPEKYILFVGMRNSYKNFERLAKSISTLLSGDRDLYLVCIGGGKFSEDEQELFSSLNISNKVLQRSIDDNTLIKFYNNALAFVYPSLYEGFGIPILEAFTCGCPVILSNASCFPEVAEECAEYFDPNDEKSIRSAIEKVIYNKELRQRLREKGFEQVKKFSWEKTASETKLFYESI